MKSKFCFIRNFGRMRPGSFVYHVAVGTSEREQVKFALVREFCEDTGVYFRRWSDDVDRALEFAEYGWSSELGFSITPFRHVQVNIETIYQLIIDDSFDAFEEKAPTPKAELWLFHQRDPLHILSNQSPVSITKCLPLKRKNLSDGRRTEGGKFLVSFGLILLVFLIDAIVENVLFLLYGAI